MREMKMGEKPRKAYTKPSFTHYGDIRTFTLGASTFPGESGGFEANPNPFDEGSGSGETKKDIFE
jgi:hypothetical protein